jgi:hypothetical protein
MLGGRISKQTKAIKKENSLLKTNERRGIRIFLKLLPVKQESMIHPYGTVQKQALRKRQELLISNTHSN